MPACRAAVRFALVRLPSRLDIALAAALVVLAIVETLTASDLSAGAGTIAAAILTPAPLAWRRLAPLATLLAVTVVISAASIAFDTFDTLYVFLTSLLATYSAGAYEERRRAVIGIAFVSVWVAVGFAIDPSRGGAGDYLFVLILFGGVWALGVALRARGLHAATAEQRAELAEADALEAVAHERARIARELHDVVAHTVSLMVIQTGAVRRRIHRERPRDAELLAEVESAGRDAIEELRRLLGILRDPDEALSLAPQPGLDRLEPLVEQVREAGLPVELSVEGARVAIPAGVDLAAYRIVQESLTNALKHAKGARTAVVVRYDPRSLAIEVTDDGASQANGGGTGHGLVGMRERASLYGGTLEAGPRPGGGYAVRATLPLDAAS
jgi:signal transduction histidine kinase